MTQRINLPTENSVVATRTCIAVAECLSGVQIPKNEKNTMAAKLVLALCWVSCGLFKNQYPYEVTQQYKGRVKEFKPLPSNNSLKKYASTGIFNSTICKCHDRERRQNMIGIKSNRRSQKKSQRKPWERHKIPQKITKIIKGTTKNIMIW